MWLWLQSHEVCCPKRFLRLLVQSIFAHQWKGILRWKDWGLSRGNLVASGFSRVWDSYCRRESPNNTFLWKSCGFGGFLWSGILIVGERALIIQSGYDDIISFMNKNGGFKAISYTNRLKLVLLFSKLLLITPFLPRIPKIWVQLAKVTPVYSSVDVTSSLAIRP